MQRASDVVAILAILAGSAGSLALSALVIGSRSPEQAVEVRVLELRSQQDGTLRIPLPPVDRREIRIHPGEFRVMHVPILRRGAVVVGTSDRTRAPKEYIVGGATSEFEATGAPRLEEKAREGTRERQRHKREKRQKRRRPDGR